MHFDAAQFNLDKELVDKWIEKKVNEVSERIERVTLEDINLTVGVELYDCDDRECDDENCETIDYELWNDMVPGTYKYVLTVYIPGEDNEVISDLVVIFSDAEKTTVEYTHTIERDLDVVDGLNEWEKPDIWNDPEITIIKEVIRK
jgi:hypothetical protein